MKTITTLGLALGIAMVTAGTAAAQVKFGVGGPITAAATGAQMKNGVDQAAADINTPEGILGQKITVSYGTTLPIGNKAFRLPTSLPPTASSFIGHYNSGVQHPVVGGLSGERHSADHAGLDQPTVTERKM